MSTCYMITLVIILIVLIQNFEKVFKYLILICHKIVKEEIQIVQTSYCTKLSTKYLSAI